MKKSILFFGLMILLGQHLVNAQNKQNNPIIKGKEYLQSGKIMDAITEFSKAIDAGKNSEAFYLRGVAKTKLEDLHGAMKDLNNSIELQKNFPDAHYARGNVKFLLQDYYGAISDYSIAIEQDDDHIEAYFQRGKAQQQLSAYEEAIEDCSKILEINPKNVDALFLRGNLRIEFGQIQEGCLDLSKAGELGDVKAYEIIRTNCNRKIKDDN